MSPRKQRRGSSPAAWEPLPTAAADLAEALDLLLEEGLATYDDESAAGRRRMAELNVGFASAEALLARLKRRPRVPPSEAVPALADVLRYILHWAGEERSLAEPPETIAALRNARRAVERAASAPGAPASPVGMSRTRASGSGGAA